MAEQFKSMSPEDVREQKMRDNMGKAAEKARENSLGKADKQDADKSQPGMMEKLGNLGRKAKDFVKDTLTEDPMYKAGKMAVDSMTPEKKKAGGTCKTKKMAKGGSASSRADGCCVKGKTRGKMM